MKHENRFTFLWFPKTEMTYEVSIISHHILSIYLETSCSSPFNMTDEHNHGISGTLYPVIIQIFGISYLIFHSRSHGLSTVITYRLDMYQLHAVCPINRHIAVTSIWVRWHLQSPASRLFTQPFIQAAYQGKHQSSALLVFVRGIHRWPVHSQHKGPVTRKTFPFDDVTMRTNVLCVVWRGYHTL